MKLSLSYVVAGLAAFAAAAPASKPHPSPKGPSDVTILNYALTLEYLEAAFYKEGLAKFDAKDFADAGFPAYVRERIAQFGAQEAIHAATLKSVLGKKATSPCKYNFPLDDVEGFLVVARVLEAVGVSAYLGAAKDITSDDYLTAAASIYGIEARHQALISDFQNVDGSPSSFETPLGYSNVYTLASQFIKSCPKTNPKLPVTAFPSLNVHGDLEPGEHIELIYPKKKGVKTYYAHFLYGLNDVVIKLGKNGQVKIPSDIKGQAYIIVTDCKDLSDKTTVAGPLPFDVVTANVN